MLGERGAKVLVQAPVSPGERIGHGVEGDAGIRGAHAVQPRRQVLVPRELMLADEAVRLSLDMLDRGRIGRNRAGRGTSGRAILPFQSVKPVSRCGRVEGDRGHLHIQGFGEQPAVRREDPQFGPVRISHLAMDEETPGQRREHAEFADSRDGQGGCRPLGIEQPGRLKQAEAGIGDRDTVRRGRDLAQGFALPSPQGAQVTASGAQVDAVFGQSPVERLDRMFFPETGAQAREVTRDRLGRPAQLSGGIQDPVAVAGEAEDLELGRHPHRLQAAALSQAERRRNLQVGDRKPMGILLLGGEGHGDFQVDAGGGLGDAADAVIADSRGVLEVQDAIVDRHRHRRPHTE